MSLSEAQIEPKTPAGRLLVPFFAKARTIRGRIILSFVAMGLGTGALCMIAGGATYHAAQIVDRTFGGSFAAIEAADAAASDFAKLRQTALRLGIGSAAEHRESERGIAEQRHKVEADLDAVEASLRGPQVSVSLVEARSSLTDWDRARQELPAGSPALDDVGTGVDRGLARLSRDVHSATIDGQRSAAGTIRTGLAFILGGTAAAMVLPGLLGWLLARRTVRPIDAASAVASRIASGQFDDELPEAGDDELGAMLAAMMRMRNNIRTAMEREIALRRSAQTRLADALESSHDGIMVVDPDLRIALANGQAADFLGVPTAMLAPGAPITQLTGASRSSRKFLLDLMGLDEGAAESRLGDGRWLRVSRSWTRDGGFIALCSDISVQKKQEAELKATNLRLDAALENMSQGLCLFGADQTLQVVNRRFAEIFGLRPDAVRAGISLRELIARLADASHFPDRTADDVYMDELRALEFSTRSVRFLAIGNGRIVGIATEALADGGGWLATYEDVTERRQAEARIAYMARHDALTGLPNRVLFVERIEEAIEKAKRGSGCAVFCLDLDHFKNVNDTLGHPIGDELLRIVAARLKDCVREADAVARLGGDEFAVVQSAIVDPQEAVKLANRIVERLAQPFQIEGHSMAVGVSIGISLAPEDGQDHEKLLKNADVALYRAKEDGRGTWRFFEPEMDSRLQARREMELDLRRAVDEQQFEVYYQPQFDLRLDRISGFEALVRWNHPVRGLVPPNAFIPLAEEIGLIREIGAWVLRSACVEATRWPDPLRVAVNVSPVQLRQAEFRSIVADALSTSGLAAARLELEITESVMLGSSGIALDLLEQIHGLGVQLAMDDFGTGYSSLTSLRNFPFDKIKIDRSFVKDLCDSPAGEPFVRAVITLGQGLGIRITAEGVETAEQLARLRIEGCTEVQGYLISRPRPAGEVPNLLERWSAGARRGLVSAVA